MAREEMSPTLKKLVDQLAGAYPGDPQNEKFPRLLAELKPAEVVALFGHTFSLYRAAVDTEHESSLATKPYGARIHLSPETSQLGHIAEALVVRTAAAGVKMTFAVRDSAVDSYILHQPYAREKIEDYTSEFDGYRCFHTNEAWHDKTALQAYFLGGYGDIYFCNDSGLLAGFDVRDVYLIDAMD